MARIIKYFIIMLELHYNTAFGVQSGIIVKTDSVMTDVSVIMMVVHIGSIYRFTNFTF